ncbi:uncharacterized protein K452DRAFT_292378 [Aplosporella prunicola CBS 121167]|uniref:Chromo domain-containing protein n=1 Tax=Aplosporella prunicola CBS 121167 TaxID=1176127 RepID=A0A6A6AYW9_9PEZI|nr:uncharacterized protein K452DRAFT_292378 [Aplosporella prunicola CBS 121167]KAF2136458.1 hypothetical protein K452DRAFT_292378 [Aplosporella prunicola CBS 121167]
MPPMVSDDEASTSDADIPYKEVEKPTARADADPEEEEDDDEEADEYVVERIVSHIIDTDGSINYEVKWLGYEKAADRTWEPEENLEGAKDALQEYFDKIGGRPTAQPKQKKRKSSQAASNTPEPKGSGHRGKKAKSEGSGTPDTKAVVRKEKEWTPPAGSWEEHVQHIDTIEEEPNPKTGHPERYAFVVWNNKHKSRHQLSVLNHKCPQKMLAYYEQHLYFKK